MLDATLLKGWCGVGHVNVPCRTVACVRRAWTQLKEETDAAAADDLYDPGDDSDDAEDEDADDDDDDDDNDDGDDDDDDDDDDDYVHYHDEKTSRFLKRR